MQYVIGFIILLFIIGQCSKDSDTKTSSYSSSSSSSYSPSYNSSSSSSSSSSSKTNTATPTPTTTTTQKTTPIPKPKPTSNSGNCDPNYTGCVPIASDVDCAGGRGNGPAYVRGPIRVIGKDIYDLDRDGDGIACE